MAGNGTDPSNAWWSKALDASSPSMLRGGAGVALFIGATRWVPESLPGLLENYVDYGLVLGAAMSAGVAMRGVFTGK